MPERAGTVDPPQDGSPSWDEVEQHEAKPELPIAAVPVHVDGPVQVHQLPPRTSVATTLLLDAAAAGVQPIEMLAGDRRRSRALILAQGGGIVFGTTKLACIAKGATSPATGAAWPAGLALTILGSSQLWVAAATTAVTLTVLSESWAD